MHKLRWPICLVSALLVCFTHPLKAQTVLTPVSQLSQGAGCFSLRCFIWIGSFEDATAVTVNTGGGVAIHTPSNGDIWNVQQVITNPDYPDPPSPYSIVHFGPPAFKGQSLLIGGTSPRYSFKDVVYVYAPINGRWTHLQTLALQRPADYDRTHIAKIATDGTTAIVSGTRVKDAIDEEAFTQVDTYLRNTNGTFSRRGGFKPPIPADRLWSSSIEVDGNVIVISDPGADNESGRVHVYGYDVGRGWRLRVTLAAAQWQAGARFGEHIALDGNTIVIAAPAETDPRPEFTGAVYIYQGSGKTWPLQQKLRAITDPKVMGYQFGNGVDVSGERIVVGKYINDFSGSIPTHAYIYERRASWVPVAELVDMQEGIFNVDVHLSGDIAIASGTDWSYGRPNFVFDLPALGTLPAVE
ncbi:MAG: hypothetical protein ACJ8MR_12360 [Povalibacter sp.]